MATQKTIANELQDMKNNDDGNSKECSCRANRPLCLKMFQLGHTWSLTADIFECSQSWVFPTIIYIQISLCLQEYGAIDSDIWPVPTKNCLQDDSSIQRGATKKGQPQASLRAPERRKTSGVLLKKDPDMHKERAIENRHHGGSGWIASWWDGIWLEPGK